MDQLITPDVPEESQVKVEKPVNATESLALDIDDAIFDSIIQKKIDETEAHNRSNLKLPDRRKRNYDFWRGDQLDEGTMEP